jgi:hypothetical protein
MSESEIVQPLTKLSEKHRLSSLNKGSRDHQGEIEQLCALLTCEIKARNLRKGKT